MNITQLIKDCYQAAIDRGVYNCTYCKGKRCVLEMNSKTVNNKICLECKGKEINPNININEKIALINLELYKALDAYQKNRFANKTCLLPLSQRGYILYADWYKKSRLYKALTTFEYHLAGVFIKIFELAGYTKFNLHLHQSELYKDNWGNVAEDLKLINYEVNSKDFSFVISLLNGFCFHHNIDIETHIKLRMEHEKRRY